MQQNKNPESKLKHWIEQRPDLWLPTWQDVINNLNECQGEAIFHTDTMGVICHEVKHKDYSRIHEVAAMLSGEYNNAPVSSHTYISFIDSAKTFGKHVDDLDVYFLQAIGQTQFSVWEDDIEHTHKLNPGDLLYIPAGLYHDTKPLTPRVGISYGVEL
jgi:ribosomal protein L16 Arg81 hydroxylase